MHNFVMFGLKKSVIENSGKLDPIHYAGSVAALPAFLSFDKGSLGWNILRLYRQCFFIVWV